MLTLKKLLQDRLSQLEDRRFMIPRYVSNPGAWLGKNDFSLNDLPKINEQILEVKICLKALEEFNQSVKPNSNDTHS